MAKKAKKKMHQMPKLSILDQLIYWTIFVLLAFLWVGVILAHIFLRKHIAFVSEMVIATEDKASYLWVMVPWMTFFLITFILWVIPYQDRKPIFGLRNFKYGPPAWPKVYPVFMKNKPYVWVSEKQKKGRKWMALILLLVFLISMIPYPLSLYGRECLLSDGSIEQYNMFNAKVREYTSGQIAAVDFEVYRHGTGRTSVRKAWDVRVTLTTDTGRDYTFEYRDFRDAFDGEPRNWLAYMLQLKDRYIPDIITYTGADNLSNVIGSKTNWHETEVQMLYQLFGLSG